MTTKSRAEIIGEALGTIFIVAVVAPLLLICGANWLLEAAGHAQLDYTWATWFGAYLIGVALRCGARSKS